MFKLKLRKKLAWQKKMYFAFRFSILELDYDYNKTNNIINLLSYISLNMAILTNENSIILFSKFKSY